MAKKRKRQKPVHLEEELTPNLIPLIDIMFLLLLFLMLGSDMGQRQFENVILPKVDASSVKEDKENDNETGITIVNVYHDPTDTHGNSLSCKLYKDGGICASDSHWKIGIRGKDYNPQTIGALIKEEAALGKEAGDANGISERKVQIRGDQAALYGHVQKVITACAMAGVYKIEIGAAADL